MQRHHPPIIIVIADSSWQAPQYAGFKNLISTIGESSFKFILIQKPEYGILSSVNKSPKQFFGPALISKLELGLLLPPPAFRSFILHGHGGLQSQINIKGCAIPALSQLYNPIPV